MTPGATNFSRGLAEKSTVTRLRGKVISHVLNHILSCSLTIKRADQDKKIRTIGKALSRNTWQSSQKGLLNFFVNRWRWTSFSQENKKSNMNISTFLRKRGCFYFKAILYNKLKIKSYKNVKHIFVFVCLLELIDRMKIKIYLQ